MNIHTDQLARQAQEIIRAANEARIPEAVQTMAGEGLAKTRDAYHKASAAALQQAKAAETLMLTVGAGAKMLGTQVMDNAMTNGEAAFDAAQAIARAKTLPEVARVQADFMQGAFETAGNQLKQFLELSAKVTEDAFNAWQAAAKRSLDQLGKAG